jgi:glycosyltransferase involved in cell wall biosynthesis
MRYDRRPEIFAQHFGTQAAFISRGKKGKIWQVPFRYVAQARDTWKLLMRERPDVVLIQCPPVFAVFTVMRYAKATGTRYAIDAGTGAFLSPKWRWSQPLLRIVARNALTTLVTNDYLKSVVEGWGARADIMAFTPAQYPAGEPYLFAGDEKRFHVFVVSTYEIDEPLDVVIQTARQMPEVSFYITGNPQHAPSQRLAHLPTNCHLTGYLPYPKYIGLMRSSDVVMDLTTRNHTLLMGAFEAVSLGMPLIVSDWPILRSYFGKGAICVPNTVEGLRAGVLRAQREQETLKHDVRRLREDLDREWNQQFGNLLQLIEGGSLKQGVQQPVGAR